MFRDPTLRLVLNGSVPVRPVESGHLARPDPGTGNRIQIDRINASTRLSKPSVLKRRMSEKMSKSGAGRKVHDVMNSWLLEAIPYGGPHLMTHGMATSNIFLPY